MPEDQNENDAPETLLSAKGINKTFADNGVVQVLSDLDLELAAGEMISVVGASGSGKSTLLHILGTLDRPSTGELLFEGQNLLGLSKINRDRFRNRTIGFIFQFHHLLPEFNTLENVIIPGLIAGQAKPALNDRAHDLLDRTGLGHRALHKVGELSGGEQQRLAIARALIMKPKLLLADEPTGNLDPKTGRKIFDLLLEMNSSLHLSMVMVTHNHELATSLDRCLTLKNGKLQ